LKITLHTVALQTSIFVELAKKPTFGIQLPGTKLLRIVEGRFIFLQPHHLLNKFLEKAI